MSFNILHLTFKIMTAFAMMCHFWLWLHLQVRYILQKMSLRPPYPSFHSATQLQVRLRGVHRQRIAMWHSSDILWLDCANQDCCLKRERKKSSRASVIDPSGRWFKEVPGAALLSQLKVFFVLWPESDPQECRCFLAALFCPRWKPSF